MIFIETKLKGAYVIDIKRHEDDRGFFGRSWCENEMREQGLNTNVRNINVSFSKTRGTLRGLHYQKNPYQEVKIIRCTRGAIYDVIIDLRKDSPTYKHWFGIELTPDNYKMVYVPEDFAHGYMTLCGNSEATYLTSQFYTPGAEAGIRWNDPEFNVDWPLKPKVISEKDKQHPDFMSEQYSILMR